MNIVIDESYNIYLIVFSMLMVAIVVLLGVYIFFRNKIMYMFFRNKSGYVRERSDDVSMEQCV